MAIKSVGRRLTARNFVRASSESITCDIGACTFTGSKTIAAIVRKTTDGTTGYFIKVGAGVGTDRYMVGVSSGNTPRIVEGSTVCNSSAMTCLASEGWVFLAVGKTSGTNTPRFHKYVYSTGVWTHEDGANTLADATATATSVTLGAEGANYWNGDIAIVDVWNANLTDAQMELLPFRYAAWFFNSPKGIWLLNQQSVSDTVKDLSGGGANESSRTGTTVVTEGIPQFDFGDVVAAGVF